MASTATSQELAKSVLIDEILLLREQRSVLEKQQQWKQLHELLPLFTRHQHFYNRPWLSKAWLKALRQLRGKNGGRLG